MNLGKSLSINVRSHFYCQVAEVFHLANFSPYLFSMVSCYKRQAVPQTPSLQELTYHTVTTINANSHSTATPGDVFPLAIL